jgi:transposase
VVRRDGGIAIIANALKMAICHRRSSPFYRTQNGANVGDMLASLIHAAELHGPNPFEYLKAVLRHSSDAAVRPGDWLPWTDTATLARLSED